MPWPTPEPAPAAERGTDRPAEPSTAAGSSADRPSIPAGAGTPPEGTPPEGAASTAADTDTGTEVPTPAPVLGSLTTREVAQLLADGPLDVIVPLGALEQHGPHLPLSTDQIIAEALAAEAAARCGECAVAPCLPVGVSPHHLGFAGTASVTAETMAELQVNMVASLLDHGFRCAYVVTGHAGNAGSMAEAERRLAEGFAGRVVSFADWPAQRKAVHAAAAAMGLDPERVGTHAGHFETSIMCLLRPDLVNLAAAEPGWIGPAATAGETLRSRGMAALSPIGVIGDPTGADAEAGRAYLDALVAHVVSGVARHRRPRQPTAAGAATAAGLSG